MINQLCGRFFVYRIAQNKKKMSKIELEIKALLSIKTTGLKEDGGDLLFHCYAVPLALQGLTSMFGMGRGGTLVQ